jgi:hypothetical protein
MITRETGGRFLNGKGGRMGGRTRAWRSRRAVSDVVATILLLALTVTLFASIFAFVTSFPPPPSQNSNQFQATLSIGPNASSPGDSEVTSVNILHLAGPAVLAGAVVYLKSAVNPKGPEFTLPYSLVAGGIPAGKTWSLGQSWVLSSNFTGGNHPALPDNITVYIVQSTSLLFSVVLPGQVISPPPSFLAVGTTPSVPVVGGAFLISATVSGTISSVTVTLSGLPGSFSSTPITMNNPTSGLYTWSVPAGQTTASGNYYVFLTATNTVLKTTTTAVPVDITSYTTLISSALTVTASGAEAKCTTAYTVIANGCKGGDYIYTVGISASSVLFGSVLFEVLTKTGTAYSPAADSTFSIVNASTHIVRAYYSQTATGAFVMNGNTPFTYPTTGVITAVSPLAPVFYQVVIDTGVTTTAWAGNSLQFVAIGQGSYFGTSVPVALP